MYLLRSELKKIKVGDFVKYTQHIPRPVVVIKLQIQ